MAIEFTETFPQYIDWGNGYRTGLSQRSFMWRAYYNAFTTAVIHGAAWITVGSSTEELTYSFTANGGQISFAARWSGGFGQWTTNSTYNAIGQWYHFAITYNNTSASNNPVIYVNGVSVAITENTAPSGTYAVGGVNQQFGLGGWGANTINGYEKDLCIYNRILSAAEILEAYNEGEDGFNQWVEHNSTGLVFNPNLNMATGVLKSEFVGKVLGASNTILDRVSCAVGAPFSNPIGA